MKSYTNVQIIGNVGGDPNVRTFEDGTKKVEFSVASTEGGYTTKSGKVVPEETTWLRVVCFGQLADTCAQYVKKGMAVFVEASIHGDKFVDKTGAKREVLEFRADRVIFLSSANPTGTDQNAATAQENAKRAEFEKRAQAIVDGFDINAGAKKQNDDTDLPF